jgi:hypothetical protein
MRIQEIQRVPGDKEGLSTKGQNWGKETLSKIKMLPGSQRFGYIAGEAGRAGSFLTGADTIIELFDVKHPEDGLRKAGFLSLRAAPWFPIKNSYQVANVGLDGEYRGTGLGQNLYGIAMKLLGMTIVADDTQTPQARSSWLRLSQVPGVAINGYASLFADDWAKRNNRSEIYDDSAKRLISSLLQAGGQVLGEKSPFVYISFPVGNNADQTELQAVQKGIAIYSARHPEDGGTEHGLYARWGGQGQQGMAEELDEAVTDNYLYHATQPAGMMRILRSGAIKASFRPQEATKAKTQYPTVSTTRSKQYAESDDFVDFLNLPREGNSVIIIFDRSKIANHYKMFSTSQGTQTVGDEFEEVIVVPKGSMPIQGTIKGFYFNPARAAEIEEFKNTPWFKELLNSPYYIGQKIEPSQFAAEAEYGTDTAKEIEKYFKKAGYKKLGTGADANVYAKDEQNVIKILMPEDPSTQSEQVFNKFYEFSAEHNDIKNLPKFNSVSKFDVLDKEYTMINMERLYPIKNNSFEEAMVWMLSDLSTQRINWNQALKIIQDEATWEGFTGEVPVEEIFNRIDNLDDRDRAEYGVLFTVMTLLYHTGRINKIGWDLHTENVMQRSDGTLVIIDPWFAITEDLR